MNLFHDATGIFFASPRLLFTACGDFWNTKTCLTAWFGVAGFDLVLLSFTLHPPVLGRRAGAGAGAYGAPPPAALITAGPWTPARPTSINYSIHTQINRIKSRDIKYVFCMFYNNKSHTLTKIIIPVYHNVSYVTPYFLLGIFNNGVDMWQPFVGHFNILRNE